MYVGSSDASSKSALNLVQIVHPTLRTTCSLGAPPHTEAGKFVVVIVLF